MNTQGIAETVSMVNAELYNWYALYVKSRHEFIASDELTRKGVETFLPSVKRQRYWKDRKKLVEFPLFPGYLFVHIYPHPEDFQRVLKTRGTVTLLSHEPGYPTSISREEINSLKMMIESGEQLNVYPHLKEGASVRVKRGPLRGAEGILARRDDQELFLVNIDILGRSIGMQIHADDIEEA